MITKILLYLQPLVVIVPFISGLLCLIVKDWNTAAKNFFLAGILFGSFYGFQLFQSGKPSFPLLLKPTSFFQLFGLTIIPIIMGIICLINKQWAFAWVNLAIGLFNGFTYQYFVIGNIK